VKSKNKLRFISILLLSLFCLSLIQSASIQEAKAFPELITDTFEYDSMETLHWDYFDTSSSGVFEIENGVLNYSVFSTAILINDGSNTTWDDFNYLQSNEFSVGGEYGCYSSDLRYEGWVGDNITEIDGVSRLDVDFSFTNSSDNYYWGLRLYLTNNTELNYFENQTGVNTISFEPIDNVSAYGFYFYMKNFPFAVVEFNFINVHYLGSLTTGDDEMRRELEAEDEEFYFETLIESVVFYGIQAYNFLSIDSQRQIKLVLDSNTTHVICNIRMYDGSWWINTDIGTINQSYFENNKLLLTFEISLEKELNWKIIDFSDKTKLIDYNNSDVRMPLGYDLQYIDIEDWVSNDGLNFTSLFYYHYITTYFYSSPIARERRTETTYEYYIDSFLHLYIDDTNTVDSVYTGWDIFYPDLQNLAFIWRGISSSYYEGDVKKRYVSAEFVYGDGTSEWAFYMAFYFYDVTYETKIDILTTEWAQTTINYADKKDFGVSFNLGSDGTYKLKLYETDQADSDFTIINDPRAESICMPDPTKNLIGVKFWHQIYTNVISVVNMESWLQEYSVTYGQDYQVPEVSFPQSVASTPDIGTEAVPFWVLPIIFFMQLIATIFFGIIGFINKAILEPVSIFIMSTLPILINGFFVWLWGLLEVALALIVTTLQTIFALVITWIVDTFNAVMSFLGITFTWADFVEILLLLPYYIANSLSFLSFIGEFVLFIMGLAFEFITFITPYTDLIFYYVGEYWVFGMFVTACIVASMCLAENSLSPLMGLLHFIVGIFTVVINIFIWAFNLVITVIQILINIVRG
jgi:hypothetical protein